MTISDQKFDFMAKISCHINYYSVWRLKLTLLNVTIFTFRKLTAKLGNLFYFYRGYRNLRAPGTVAKNPKI